MHKIFANRLSNIHRCLIHWKGSVMTLELVMMIKHMWLGVGWIYYLSNVAGCLYFRLCYHSQLNVGVENRRIFHPTHLHTHGRGTNVKISMYRWKWEANILCGKKVLFRQLHPYYLSPAVLTQWGRVTHICVSKLTIIGSDNGLSPGRRQAIIWTNDGILLIGPLGTNCSEILSEIYTFSFKKMYLKTSSAKWRPFCLGLGVLKYRMIFRPPPSVKYHVKNNHWANRRVSQMRALLVACRELAVDYSTLREVLYVFEHKTWYSLIHAPLWYFDTSVMYHPMISKSQICYTIPTFWIAAI